MMLQERPTVVDSVRGEWDSLRFGARDRFFGRLRNYMVGPLHVGLSLDVPRLFREVGALGLLLTG